MKNKQDLLGKSILSRVATFETSKKLNWKYLADKYWIRHNNGDIGIAYPFDLVGKDKNNIEILCRAPSFEEVWEQLENEIEFEGKFYTLLFKNKEFLGYFNEKAECVFSVCTFKNHLAEAAALLYLQVKKENIF